MLRRFPARFPPPRARRTPPASPAGPATSPRVVAPALRPLVPPQHPDFPFFSPICGTIVKTITITDGASDGTNLVAGARNLRSRRTAPRARRRLGVPGARVERLSRSCRPRSPARPNAAQKRRTRLAPPAAPAARNPGRGRVSTRARSTSPRAAPGGATYAARVSARRRTFPRSSPARPQMLKIRVLR